MILSFDFSTWWEGLRTLEQIYWGFAIPFSVIFIIQLVTTVIGVSGDSDLDNMGDADADVDMDSGIGFQFISLKNFIGFFTIFGWSGLAFLDYGLSDGFAIFLSVCSGVLMMVIMAGLFYMMGRLTESGTFSMNSSIGKTGTVYLRIPANKAGLGKVQVNVQGLKTLNAMTENPEDIKTGSIVRIVAVLSEDILLVELI